jgi:hypothetical protein
MFKRSLERLRERRACNGRAGIAAGAPNLVVLMQEQLEQHMRTVKVKYSIPARPLRRAASSGEDVLAARRYQVKPSSRPLLCMPRSTAPLRWRCSEA